MSKILHVKTLSMLMAAAALCGPAAYAAETEAPAEVPQAQAATSECTGEVVDETGEPLIGATVRVVGTSIAGATDLEGRFTLKGVKVGAQLQVNYIGYNPATVTWSGKPVTITLQEDSHTLEEVVVMGYGIQQKRANVTNSIAKVSEETLTVGSYANPAQALAGAVAGVKVKVTSGDPSATPSIVIRGGTNFDGSGDPLVVVDGQIRSSMADINPNDIGDMQILKDAGATALYGARAANGVILITTKQGKKGSASINLDVKYGMSWYTDTGYDWVGAEDFLYWYRTGYANSSWANISNLSGANTGGTAAATGSTTVGQGTYWNVMTLTDDNAHYVSNYGWKTMVDPLDASKTILFKETSPLDYNLQTPAHSQNYNLSFTGGNDQGQYYASLGYYDADGAFSGTFYKRYNFAFTGSYKIAPWLEAQSNFTYTRANWEKNPPQASSELFFGRIMSMPPVIRYQDEEGNQLYGNNGTNLKFQPDAFDRDYQSDKFQMTQSLIIKPYKGVTVKGTMSWYYNEEVDEAFNHEYVTSVWGATNSNYSSSASFYRYFDQTYNIVATYSNTFNEKHDVNAMLGMEYYKRRYRGFSASGYGAPTGDFPDLALTSSEADVRSIDSFEYEEAILSYMGRFEYNYDSKYHIAATFRDDGYSRLLNNRWGFFPGVSAGWTMSRENFWRENQHLAFINYAKLRASFGLNGVVNTTTIGYYNLQGVYSAFRYNSEYGYRISDLPNPDLKWEKTRTFEVGVDLGFLQDRIQLNATYYNRLTMDKYASLDLPKTTGFSTVTTNNGSLRNQGLELDVTATLIRTRDFTWSLGANITYNKNVVVDLPNNDLPNNRQSATQVYDGTKLDEDGKQAYTYIGGYQEGQEPYHLIGYKKSKILRSQADVDALGDYIDIAGSGGVKLYATEAGLARLEKLGLASGAVQLQPGDVAWCDRNGDNMIDTYDQYDLGNRLAHWNGGFHTTLSWKGISLYARFDMGFDFTVYDGPFGWWMGCAQGGYSFPSQIFDTWTADNPGAKWPRYTWASQLGTDHWTRTSDILAQNGSYLACRELQLSYTLPQAICNKFYCKGLTVSVTGQNLGYIKSCTNPLPDNTTYTSGWTSGWGGTYNLPRTLLFGLNVTF